VNAKLQSAKIYWLRYFPLEEMPNVASTIAESYRNNLITEFEAIRGMRFVEREIKKWIKNNELIDNFLKEEIFCHKR
jgi:hypothetical protein